MKKLTALAFAAAMVPALALSTAAFAEERDDNTLETKERAGEERAGEQRTARQSAGEQHLSGKPAGAFYADDIIGETVKHRGSDEDVGEIQDLVIGEDGRVMGVVVTTGGFLGLGGQDISLGWDQIEHTTEDGDSVFYTDVDEEALRKAPEYERE